MEIEKLVFLRKNKVNVDQALILMLLRKNGSCAQTDLRRFIPLSVSNMSRICRDMIARKLICYTPIYALVKRRNGKLTKSWVAGAVGLTRRGKDIADNLDGN